jgi:hypothetical protein
MSQVGLDPAKGRFMEAFFQYHRQRAERLVEVWQQGHQGDAFTLCCCYLDGLASFAYYDSKRSAFNFEDSSVSMARTKSCLSVHP